MIHRNFRRCAAQYGGVCKNCDSRWRNHLTISYLHEANHFHEYVGIGRPTRCITSVYMCFIIVLLDCESVRGTHFKLSSVLFLKQRWYFIRAHFKLPMLNRVQVPLLF